MAERVDCVVIGAGVVGLAVARACALAGLETIVVDAAESMGTGTSSRNSEVIHAGIYYAPDSLKARLCVRGRHELYDYCEGHGVAHQRCGKLIVATHDTQLNALRALGVNAAANGVDNLRWLDGAEARALEPAVRCTAALESPSTGIVDSHGFMLALLGDLESAGGMLALRSPVIGGQVRPGEGILLRIGSDTESRAIGTTPPTTSATSPGDPTQGMEILAAHVFNCAGLHATHVAAGIDGIAPSSIPGIRYAKGNYYGLSGTAPFSRLIYPIPEPGGLGVHLTLDLGRRARFGPDVEWVDALDYTVDPDRSQAFYASIRRYWPDLPEGALHPDYAGIRPKLYGPGQTEADFIIQGAAAHGVPALVNLYGIESPGLTAALAIAEETLRVAEIGKQRPAATA